MNKRSENMKKVNAIRSAEVQAMIDTLIELDNNNGGDLGGFESFGITQSYLLYKQLNSYRAQKIAKFLGKNLSKKHLLQFAKSQNYEYRLTNKEIEKWLIYNEEALRKYWNTIEDFYRHNASLGL